MLLLLTQLALGWTHTHTHTHTHYQLSRKKKRFKVWSSGKHFRPNLLHVNAECDESRKKNVRAGFLSFSFIVELRGKLVILMNTYQIFIGSYGKKIYISM